MTTIGELRAAFEGAPTAHIPTEDGRVLEIGIDDEDLVTVVVYRVDPGEVWVELERFVLDYTCTLALFTWFDAATDKVIAKWRGFDPIHLGM